MVRNGSGRNLIQVIDSIPFSQLIFLTSSGKNYAIAIAKARGREDSSPTAKQLKQLVKRKFLSEKKERLLNKTIYSVNWEKLIEELLKKLRENLEIVLKEIEENNLDFNRIFENFEEIIFRAKDKKFEEKIKKNKYLIKFLISYFSYIANSRATKTTISEAFSFLFYFENLNFIKGWETSSSFYSLEKILNTSAMHHAHSKLKSEMAKNPSKFSKTRIGDEVFELKEEFKKENLKRDSDLEDLFFLGEIFKVVKFKPSLKIGLGEGVNSVGTEILKNNFTNEEIKQYFDSFYFVSLDYEEQIRKELSELIGEEIPQKHFLVKGKIIDKKTYEEFKGMNPNEPED